jgi:hypothetical protein
MATQCRAAMPPPSLNHCRAAFSALTGSARAWAMQAL